MCKGWHCGHHHRVLPRYPVQSKQAVPISRSSSSAEMQSYGIKISRDKDIQESNQLTSVCNAWGPLLWYYVISSLYKVQIHILRDSQRICSEGNNAWKEHKKELCQGKLWKLHNLWSNPNQRQLWTLKRVHSVRWLRFQKQNQRNKQNIISEEKKQQ